MLMRWVRQIKYNMRILVVLFKMRSSSICLPWDSWINCFQDGIYSWLTYFLLVELSPSPQETVTTYVARTRQHWNGQDTWTTWTRNKFFKIHMTCVPDTFQTRHSFMIRVSVLHRLQQSYEKTSKVWISTNLILPIELSHQKKKKR